MKVDIPKNLWLSSVDVGFYTEGLHAGSYGLTLNFSGNPLGSTDLMADILEPLTSVQLPKRKLVLFRGQFTKQDSALPLAVKAFQSWGFQVHAVVNNDQLDLPWLASVDWLILTTSKLFVPVVTNELWYTPVATDEPPQEPRIPAPDKTLLYLSKTMTVAATTRFVVNAKNVWRLL